MPYLRFTKVIINHFISKDNTISMRNMINLHTVCDDTLLGTLKFVSKIEDYQKYGALIPDGMINQDIMLSIAYKTYLDYATGKVPQDSEQTDSDDDQNPSFIIKDYEEEEQNEEYVHTPEKDKSDDEEMMYEEKDDDVAKELYGDLNITQGIRDAYMTNAEQHGEVQQNASHESGFVQEEEDAHITLTTVHDKTEEAEVLVRSTNQPQTYYALVASLSEFELKKILIDKMETNKSVNRSDIQRNLYNALVESYKTDKDILSTYGDHKSFGKSTQVEEPEFEAADIEMQQDQRNVSGHIDDQPDNEAAPKHDWFQKPDKPPTLDRAYCLRNGSAPLQRIDDNVLYKFKEDDFPRLNLRDIKDMLLLLVQKKLSNLDVDDWYNLGLALRLFTRRIVILHRVEDLQLGVESYKKKLNISRP
nr:hypothetical protein [Tanacetum cinerariifolium]